MWVDIKKLTYVSRICFNVYKGMFWLCSANVVHSSPQNSEQSR